MATSEEAETPQQQHSRCSNRRLSVCLPCVTDVSNCLLGVCYFHMNTLQKIMTLIARKTDLICKIERRERERERERVSTRSARGGRRPRLQREGNNGYSSRPDDITINRDNGHYFHCLGFSPILILILIPIHSFLFCAKMYIR
eukprot:COSAG06_NODE_643_length_13477_cov_19.795410_9_plen_143_part_00